MKVVSDLFEKQTSAKSNNDSFKELFREISKASLATQLAVGGVSGWCTGFIFNKVGKVAAAALAGGLIAFQVARHQNYIRINWNKVNKDVNGVKQKLDEQLKGKERKATKAKKFVRDNTILVTGFAGGFLLGIASG